MTSRTPDSCVEHPMLRLFPLLALLALPDPATACQPPRPSSPTPLMPDGATVLGDGGIVFRQTGDGDGDGRSPTLRDATTDAPVEGAWRQLAPGLMMFQPKTVGDRDLQIVDGNNKVALTVHQLRAQAVLATLVIKRAHATTGTSDRPPSPMMVLASQLTIELGAPLPANAVALVVTDATNSYGRMWFAPTKDQKTFVARLGGGKSCGGGMSPVYAGEKITVAWVDAHGRVSPPSRPIRVARR
jgi:hypothetical protein